MDDAGHPNPLGLLGRRPTRPVLARTDGRNLRGCVHKSALLVLYGKAPYGVGIGVGEDGTEADQSNMAAQI